MLFKLLVLALIGCVASQGVADTRCIQPDPVPAIRLPSETDCTRHYICQQGNKHLMPACPTGMIFDPVTLTCRPGSACLPIPPTTIPPVGTPGTEATTTTEETTTPTTTESTLSPTNPDDSTSESTTSSSDSSTNSDSTTSSASSGPSSAPPVFPTVPSKIIEL